MAHLHDVNRPDARTEEAWRRFDCGRCGAQASGAVLGYTSEGDCWLRCNVCQRGSVISGGVLSPGTPAGPVIEGLPEDVDAIYEEARRCYAVGAYAAVVLLCRKTLMHLAVDKGAKAGESFASYLDHLDKAGYVTPPMRDWVKLIKDHGNEANHEIVAVDASRAKGTLMFTAELLRLSYEMAALAMRYGPAAVSDEA